LNSDIRPLTLTLSPQGRGEAMWGPFRKGEITLPPFMKACLPVGRGGKEGFKISFSDNLKLRP